MTRNRQTQMIADLFEEENISLKGLNAKQNRRESKRLFFSQQSVRTKDS